MKQNSFHGIIGGKNYRLFARAVPHFKEFQAMVASEVEQTTPNKPSVKLLEIGCGPGSTTYNIAKLYDESDLTIIDIEQDMIEQAKKNLAEFENITYVCDDAIKYLNSLEDNSIDTIFSAWTIHNFTQEEKTSVYQQIHRVLKNGGYFINGDKFAQENSGRHNTSLLKQLEQIREVGIDIKNKAWGAKWIDHYLFDNTPNIVMYEQSTKQFLENLGFRNIETIYRKQMEAVVTAKKEVRK